MLSRWIRKLTSQMGQYFFKVLNSLVRFSPLCFSLVASILLIKIIIDNVVPSRNFRLIVIHLVTKLTKVNLLNHLKYKSRWNLELVM